jgi:mono/diheme cytochrome c family protein
MNLNDLTASPLGPVLGASTVQSVGAVIGALVVVGFVIYVIGNLVAGRREVGSEIELAPNRKPYLSDEELETTKLNRTLVAGLGLLLIIAVGLPLYWLGEPGRMDGAEAAFNDEFVHRGEEQYEDGSHCADCHGPEGSGGVASYTLFNDNEEYVATVSWQAPALDTIALRFSDEEIFEIIEYGRPGTPMQGWGAGGQGPLTEQQIDNLIDYLMTLTPDDAEVREDIEAELADDLGVAAEAIDYGDPATGEALFNMDGLASGTYACARCHTQGCSIDTENLGDPREPMQDFPDWVHSPAGSGAFGPPLSGVVTEQFATVDELAEFVATGDAVGEGFGRQRLGSGRMPAFAHNPNTEEEFDGMYTREMVCAVALYVANLDESGEPSRGLDFSGESGDFCSDDFGEEEDAEGDDDEESEE